MSNTSTYEKIVKIKSSGSHLAKKISLVMAYILFLSVWVIAAAYNPQNLVLIAAAGLLCTVLLIALTWKYLEVEYEYSFWYGSMSVAKIYAKRKRKTLVSAEMKKLLIIAPATQENIRKAEGFEPEKTVLALSGDDSADVWLTVTGDKNEKRVLIFFEADDRSLAMLKQASPFVFVKKI